MANIIFGGIITIGIISLLVVPTIPISMNIVMFPLITWQTIQAGATIVGPIVGVTISFLLWIHKRIDVLEDKAVTTRGALFGNDENPLQKGFISELNDISMKISELERRVSKLEREMATRSVGDRRMIGEYEQRFGNDDRDESNGNNGQ